jgi:pyruvate formate lyase activating enzyme
MTHGVVFDIKRFAIHDGPGIRLTVFFKGCASRCWWCHNPESQQSEPEMVTRIINLDGIDLEEHELIGKTMTIHDVMAEIEKDITFFDESGGGVTFSGGEPLMQPEFLVQLLMLCRNKGIHTALDTSGYAAPDIFKSIVDKVDLFLYDLKFINDEWHKKYSGVSNRQILQNLSLLIAAHKNVIVRFPVVPEITDSEENIKQIKSYLKTIRKGINEIDLLPFHSIARGKYKSLCKENKMRDTKEPSQERLKQLKKEFEQLNLNVKIGG